MVNSICNLLVEADNVCDYIPVVSTLSNLTDLFQKSVVFSFISPQSVNNSYYYRNLEKKSVLRCVVLLIPVIGNIIVGIYDFVNRKYNDKAFMLVPTTPQNLVELKRAFETTPQNLVELKRAFEGKATPSLSDVEFNSLPPQQESPEAVIPYNSQKHRYSNFLPLRQTIFAFDQNNPETTHVHANWILDKTHIMTQGPLKNTIGDFYNMVLNVGCTEILMFLSEDDFSKGKCACYWGTLGTEVTYGDLTVLLAQQTAGDTITRKIKLTKTGQEPVLITQTQLIWEDYSATGADALYNFVVEKLKPGNKQPFIGHCSAGVGRSGTFFAALQIIQELQRGSLDPDLIQKTASTLRHERNGAIQTLEQYQLLYQIAIKYCENRTPAKSLHRPLISAKVRLGLLSN